MVRLQISRGAGPHAGQQGIESLATSFTPNFGRPEAAAEQRERLVRTGREIEFSVRQTAESL